MANKKCIKPQILTFEIGWYILEICNFNYSQKPDGDWFREETCNDTLKGLRLFHPYWHLADGVVSSKTALQLGDTLHFFVLTDGWALWGDGRYGVRISSNATKLFEQYIHLPEALRFVISSYHSLESDRFSIFHPQDNTRLNLSAMIYDVTLECHIRETLISCLSPLICVHELDQRTGDIHIVHITSVEYTLTQCKPAEKDDSYAFTREKNPNEPKYHLGFHQNSVFQLNYKLTFVGPRTTYAVTQVGKSVNFPHALLKISPLYVNYTALKIGGSEQLVVLGKVWTRYHQQSWHAL